jgi:amidase
VREFGAARVARLATVDREGRPHVVPICFVVDGTTLYTAVDEKPKRTRRLRRLDNIAANPRVEVLIDHYEDDWSKLWWVRLRGRARIVEDPRAVDLLAAKYPQYRERPPGGPVIAIEIEERSRVGELAFLSATSGRSSSAAARSAPSSLVETCLERIERLDPELNAFVTVCARRRWSRRRASSRRPFRGVLFLISDLQETAGIRTAFSSRAYHADYVPDSTSQWSAALKGAGVVVIGKTNTPELGITAVTESRLNGVCRNPWDTSRTPGGSSGGAAAAVAAGLAPAAHGTDGGGSIRIPASCCGVFGVKPARGRVSLAPYGGHEGFSTSGALTRTVLDAAGLLDVIAGYEPGDPWWAPPPDRPFADEVGAEPGQLRIALTTTPPIDAAIAPECVAAAEDAASLLTELGHEVEESTPPWADGELLGLFMTVWKVIPGMRGKPRELFEPMNQVLLDAGDEINAVDYAHATQALRGGRAGSSPLGR